MLFDWKFTHESSLCLWDEVGVISQVVEQAFEMVEMFSAELYKFALDDGFHAFEKVVNSISEVSYLILAWRER